MIGVQGPLFFIIVLALGAIALWRFGIGAIFLVLICAISFLRAGNKIVPLTEDIHNVDLEFRGRDFKKIGKRFYVIGRIQSCSISTFVNKRVVVEFNDLPVDVGPIRVVGIADFQAPRASESEGDFNERAWFIRQGWFARVRIKKSSMFIEPQKGAEAKKHILNDALAQSQMSPYQKRLSGALLFGKGSDLLKSDRQPFSNTGTAHVLAVSGLHVGMVFLILTGVSKIIAAFRIRRALQFGLVVTGLFSYSWLTDFSPSVVRSSIMFSGWMISILLERDRYSLNGLWLAAFISLMIWPRWIYSAGFHLSYAAVIAIILGLKNWAVPGQWPNWIKKIVQMAQVTLFAQMGTFVFSTYYFGLFPVYFLPANLIFTPLVAVLLYGCWTVLLAQLLYLGVYQQWIEYVYGAFIDMYSAGLSFIGRLPNAVLNVELGLFHLLSIGLFLWTLICRIDRKYLLIIGLSLVIANRLLFWVN